MLDIPTRAHVASEHAALGAMFAARKQVFIDLLRWDLPVLAGEYEVDQFDNPDAQYLILLDRDGRHRASARLLPTDRPHILGDLYPNLCDGEIPSGPTTFEITPFCLDRNQNTAERRSARNHLVTALADHALRCGITDYTGVAELAWFSQILTFGWQCVPLGPTMRANGQLLAGLHILIDERTIDGLKRGGIHEPPTLQLIGAGKLAA